MRRKLREAAAASRSCDRVWHGRLVHCIAWLLTLVLSAARHDPMCHHSDIYRSSLEGLKHRLHKLPAVCLAPWLMGLRHVTPSFSPLASLAGICHIVGRSSLEMLHIDSRSTSTGHAAPACAPLCSVGVQPPLLYVPSLGCRSASFCWRRVWGNDATDLTSEHWGYLGACAAVTFLSLRRAATKHCIKYAAEPMSSKA